VGRSSPSPLIAAGLVLSSMIHGDRVTTRLAGENDNQRPEGRSMTLSEVLIPTSPEEAMSQFGDGSNIEVLAGGTISMPELNYGRKAPARVLLLARAGLSGVTVDGQTVTIGAATPVQALVTLAAPIGLCAANVADLEIRAQATVGGNLCAGPGPEAPRGDLQGALLAVEATARSAGAGGVKEEPLSDFLAHRGGRLLLSVSYAEPTAGGFAALDRKHTHEYTALAVSGARAADGTIRLAATGVAGPGTRLPSAEKHVSDPVAAGNAALADVRLHDDALASAWYRSKTLPVLVQRVLAQIEEGR
jgi:CO/xanthine dehydrogenase FAD-binding subunit